MPLDQIKQKLGLYQPGSSPGESESPEQKRRLKKIEGILDLCILSIVSERPRSGFEIIQELDKSGVLAAGQGSTYPIPYGMEREGLLSSFRTTVEGTGRIRKYYQLTADGARTLERWNAEWGEFKRDIDGLLRGSGQ